MDTLVLKVFHDTNNSSFKVVFTSRKAFLNLARSVQDQNEHLFACSDGTYKSTKSESEEAYREFFFITRRFCNLFIGFDLEVRFGSLDHCAAIDNAFQAEWISIELLNCWPHYENSGIDSRIFHISMMLCIHPYVVWMHACRTYAQFRVLGRRHIDKWKLDGEMVYAFWSEDVYIKLPWDTWFIGSAGNVSGVLPNQNTIEEFHRTLK
ncbi:hypothetical protein P3T76_009928 [Phytophthora citrophthora]|uniref:Uncharacterized protein n=1 Tax=Phytophthora citrophthora TaxID=4793 RepID=A0AAD9GEP5_9STRA|nr:hypothetical protein P3T76_009928 [Phytophthora citrophthora]